MEWNKEILKYGRTKDYFFSNYNEKDFRESLMKKGYDFKFITKRTAKKVMILFKRIEDEDFDYRVSYSFSQLYLHKSKEKQYMEHKKYKTLVNVWAHYLDEIFNEVVK